MTNQKYNGWTNRETWVVNLHLGEALHEVAQDYCDNEADDYIDYNDLASYLEDYVNELFESELDNMSLFLKDLLYIDSVNWYELAEHYRSDCE